MLRVLTGFFSMDEAIIEAGEKDTAHLAQVVMAFWALDEKGS